MARKDSGLTLRRLAVLVRALPETATIWPIVQAEYERSLKPTPEQIRARQEHYKNRREGAD